MCINWLSGKIRFNGVLAWVYVLYPCLSANRLLPVIIIMLAFASLEGSMNLLHKIHNCSCWWVLQCTVELHVLLCHAELLLYFCQVHALLWECCACRVWTWCSEFTSHMQWLYKEKWGVCSFSFVPMPLLGFEGLEGLVHHLWRHRSDFFPGPRWSQGTPQTHPNTN